MKTQIKYNKKNKYTKQNKYIKHNKHTKKIKNTKHTKHTKNVTKNRTKNEAKNEAKNINKILPYDVIIVGCARDIEYYLSNTKEKLQMLKSLFKSSKIIIYENDSKDNTLNILKDWEKEKLIYLITEKDVKGTRTERLAYARNLLYNEAMKHTFDLLIVISIFKPLAVI